MLCVGGVDFLSGGYNVTVVAGETSAEVSIAIIEDSIVEVNETLSAILSVPAAEAALGVSVSAPNSTAYVEIQDNGKHAEPSTHVSQCVFTLHLPLPSSRRGLHLIQSDVLPGD